MPNNKKSLTDSVSADGTDPHALAERYGLDGEHPDYPRKDWKYEVTNDDTKLGYWDWVSHKAEADADETSGMPTVEQVRNYLSNLDGKTKVVLTEDDVACPCEFIALDSVLNNLDRTVPAMTLEETVEDFAVQFHGRLRTAYPDEVGIDGDATSKFARIFLAKLDELNGNADSKESAQLSPNRGPDSSESVEDLKVKAEVHSDDRVFEIDFDATDWFCQASDEEIVDLIGCDWGGDYPADAVAQFYEGTNAEIGTLFSYLSSIKNTRKACGFECHVDGATAVEWLRKNKPHLLFLQVEYDKAFYGGDFNGVGSFAYVPVSSISQSCPIEEAFRLVTGEDPVHIIHYSSDELYTASGLRIED